MNKIYEGYESSYQICISKLRLGLNISIKRRPIQTETQFEYAIFRVIPITLIDFVRLMSIIINHEHIVLSACGDTTRGRE